MRGSLSRLTNFESLSSSRSKRFYSLKTKNPKSIGKQIKNLDEIVHCIKEDKLKKKNMDKNKNKTLKKISETKQKRRTTKQGNLNVRHRQQQIDIPVQASKTYLTLKRCWPITN